jgi:hypothetical protein
VKQNQADFDDLASEVATSYANINNIALEHGLQSMPEESLHILTDFKR